MTGNDDHAPDVEQLFAEFLAGNKPRLGREGDADWQAFFAQHSEHEGALRKLHAECQRINSMLDRVGLTISAEAPGADIPDAPLPLDSFAGRLRYHFLSILSHVFYPREPMAF